MSGLDVAMAHVAGPTHRHTHIHRSIPLSNSNFVIITLPPALGCLAMLPVSLFRHVNIVTT